MVSSQAATMRRHEERRLLRLYHGAGDAGAREELVHRFLPLARQLARRYQRRGEPIDDLVQVASLSLDRSGDEEDAGAPADSLAIDEPGFLLAEDGI